MNDDLVASLDILRKGGVILYPTDTIWGIGCDATNPEAISKIYRIKQRQDEKSLLILLDDVARLYEYVAEVPEMALNLIEITEKPLTIIYPGAMHLAANLIAGDGSIGIRIVRDDFCSQLIKKFGKPLVSTSANVSGMPWPPFFHDIHKNIVKSVDYVVKWRQDDKRRGKPSGIIKVGVQGEVKVIRE
jgi:L-threonylcarbamoyladenylate synthase